VSDLTVAAGERIALLRKLSRLTQEQLAQKANYSVSMLRAIEQGRKPASPAFITAVARAMGRSEEEINGRPFEDLDAPPSDRAGVPELRRALVEYDYPDVDGAPLTLDEISPLVSSVKTLYGKARYMEVTTALPDLLRHLHRAVEVEPAGERRERAFAMLTLAYGKTLGTLYKLGYVRHEALCDRVGVRDLHRSAVAAAG
jgi:transcriptional regulator with XRE-family HTH domain